VDAFFLTCQGSVKSGKVKFQFWMKSFIVKICQLATWTTTALRGEVLSDNFSAGKHALKKINSRKISGVLNKVLRYLTEK
jgi:hypothetical protein